MADAKTIDNLGPEVNRRYIDDTRLLSDEEVQKIVQTPSVARRAEVLKTAPKFTEIDLLWGVQERASSPFVEPPNFVLTTDVFTYSLIPSIGTGSEIIQKLESIKRDDKKEKQKQEKGQEEEQEEKKQKDTDEERQRKILLKFAKDLFTLNKILEVIKRKQEEFHKG